MAQRRDDDDHRFYGMKNITVHEIEDVRLGPVLQIDLALLAGCRKP